MAAPGTAKAAQRAVAFGVFEGSFNAQAFEGLAWDFCVRTVVWDRLGSEKLDGLNVFSGSLLFDGQML